MSQLNGLVDRLTKSWLAKIDPRVTVRVRLQAKDSNKTWSLNRSTKHMKNIAKEDLEEINFQEANELCFDLPDIKSLDVAKCHVDLYLEEWDLYSKADRIAVCQKPLSMFLHRTHSAPSSDEAARALKKQPDLMDRWQLGAIKSKGKHDAEQEFHSNYGRCIASTFMDAEKPNSMVVVVWKLLDIRNPEIDRVLFYAYVLLFAILLAYCLMSIISFSMFEEKWSVREAIYFATVTFTTVGYGDFNASGFSQAGKLWAAIFGLLGMIVVSSAMGMIIAGVLERNASRRSRGHDQIDRSYMSVVRVHFKGLKGSIGIWFLALCANILIFLLCEEKADEGEDGSTKYSKYSVVDAFYFTIITMTAVGLGDISFSSKAGQWLGAILIPILTLTTGILCSKFGELIFRLAELKASKLNLNTHLTPALMDNTEVDLANEGFIEEDEFVRLMLMRMGKVDPTLAKVLDNKFRKLDSSKDGLLTIEDLRSTVEGDKDFEVHGCNVTSLGNTRVVVGADSSVQMLPTGQDGEAVEMVSQILRNKTDGL